MNIPIAHIERIGRLGYTDSEARLLYIVAVFSEYFTLGHFRAFTGSAYGKRPTCFAQKPLKQGHPSVRDYMRRGSIYHLFSKTLYRQIDRDNLRNRRRHSTEFIRTRFFLLDFVRTNLAHDYFETEHDKVHFFCDELGIPKESLPAKVYEGVSTPEPTFRYFVDKFPLFLDRSGGSSSPVATLSYVDPGEASLVGVANHLAAYTPLFRHLDHFRFLYIAPSTVHFVRAEQCFSSLVRGPLYQAIPEQLERYFRLRAAWDGKQYAQLSNDDIEWLDQGTRRFGGGRVEGL